MRGEHKSPAFREVNPKGKVPALAIDGTVLTENVAILWYLHERNPEARLLPGMSSPAERAAVLADLCFCSATLHPLVTRIRMPMLLAGEANASVVKAAAAAAMDENFALIEARFADRPWWFGDTWSAMDGYLYWVFWRVEGAGYDVTRFPRFVAHARANEGRPAVQRALAREQAAHEKLVAEGAAFVPRNID
jgi:glutathione S-transferase